MGNMGPHTNISWSFTALAATGPCLHNQLQYSFSAWSCSCMLSHADSQVLCVAAFYCAMPWTGCYFRCPKQLLLVVVHDVCDAAMICQG